MFNFKDELAKYRESLSVDELSEGLSGDEIQDIVDVAQELASQVLNQQALKEKALKEQALKEQALKQTRTTARERR